MDNYLLLNVLFYCNFMDILNFKLANISISSSYVLND